MFNLNKIMMAGNLTRDPDLRGLPSGQNVCELKLAVNTKSKERDEVCFIKVTVFGKAAEACKKYLAKGSGVYVEGRLCYETWEDRQSGAKRSDYKILASSVQFTSSGKGEGGQDGQYAGNRERRGGVSGEYGPPPAQNHPNTGNSDELPPF